MTIDQDCNKVFPHRSKVVVNKKKYDDLLKNKFPLICTQYCNLYLNIIPKFTTDVTVSFQGILLNNDIRRDLSQNTFTYKSNLMKIF